MSKTNEDVYKEIIDQYIELFQIQTRTIKSLEKQIETMESLAESDKRYIGKLQDWIDRLIKDKKNRKRRNKKIKS